MNEIIYFIIGALTNEGEEIELIGFDNTEKKYIGKIKDETGNYQTLYYKPTQLSKINFIGNGILKNDTKISIIGSDNNGNYIIQYTDKLGNIKIETHPKKDFKSLVVNNKELISDKKKDEHNDDSDGGGRRTKATTPKKEDSLESSSEVPKNEQASDTPKTEEQPKEKNTEGIVTQEPTTTIEVPAVTENPPVVEPPEEAPVVEPPQEEAPPVAVVEPPAGVELPSDIDDSVLDEPNYDYTQDEFLDDETRSKIGSITNYQEPTKFIKEGLDLTRHKKEHYEYQDLGTNNKTKSVEFHENAQAIKDRIEKVKDAFENKGTIWEGNAKELATQFLQELDQESSELCQAAELLEEVCNDADLMARLSQQLIQLQRLQEFYEGKRDETKELLNNLKEPSPAEEDVYDSDGNVTGKRETSAHKAWRARKSFLEGKLEEFIGKVEEYTNQVNEVDDKITAYENAIDLLERRLGKFEHNITPDKSGADQDSTTRRKLTDEEVAKFCQNPYDSKSNGFGFNLKTDAGIEIYESTTNVNGVNFTIYEVMYPGYDEELYSFNKNNLISYLSNVPTNVLQYAKDGGTDLVIISDCLCYRDITLNEDGTKNGWANNYCHGATRDMVLIGDTPDWQYDYQGNAVIHEFGHAVDLTRHANYVIENEDYSLNSDGVIIDSTGSKAGDDKICGCINPTNDTFDAPAFRDAFRLSYNDFYPPEDTDGDGTIDNLIQETNFGWQEYTAEAFKFYYSPDFKDNTSQIAPDLCDWMEKNIDSL